MKAQIKISEIVMLLAASLMSFLANLPEHLLGSLVDRRILLVTLTVVVVIAMFRYLQILLLAVISILAIGANLPAELASALGISQLALIISLGFVIAATLLNRAFKLLPIGAEPPDPATPDITNARHAMLAAISKGDLLTLKKLLAMNVGVNFTQGGTTPLHLAAEKGYSDIVQMLIDRGAEFLSENAEGKTPLEVALAKKKFIRTTEILFKAYKAYLAKPAQTETKILCIDSETGGICIAPCSRTGSDTQSLNGENRSGIYAEKPFNITHGSLQVT